jgi:chromosome segregation ATPase
MQAVQALVSAKDALDAQTIVVKATLAHQDKEERLEKELAGLRWSYNQTLQDMVVLKAAQQKAESACEGLLTQIDMKDGQIDLHRRLEEEYNAAIEGLERRMGDTHREMQKQRERAERADGEVARLTTQLGALKTEVRRGN